MNADVLKGLFEEIKSANDWMHYSAGDNVDVLLAELAKDSGDIYEVIVRVHLVNHTIIEMHNRCKDSYVKQHYVGDNIFVDSNNIVYAEYYNRDGSYHQARINPECIVMIDQYTKEVDWKDLIKKE